jgi:hypothetical protein
MPMPLARASASAFRLLVSCVLRLHVDSVYRLQVTSEADSSFDEFWKRFPKQGLMLRDRSSSTLSWRYTRHPHHRFRFAKLSQSERLVGYLVFEVPAPGDTCFIHDLVVLEPSALTGLVAMFVRYCSSLGHVQTLRMVLSHDHPWAAALWRIGFVRRQSERSFLIYGCRKAMLDAGVTWYVTSGDKDI